MEFDFDPTKSAANRDKHGLDFINAQEMWEVPGWEQPLPHKSEPRRMRVARFGARLWSAVYTMRSGSVRLISVRRARENEVNDYERHIAEGRPDPQS